MRNAASDESIEWPPSMPIIDAILPALKARSTSSAVCASTSVSGYFATMRWTMSICSRVARTASLPCIVAGT